MDAGGRGRVRVSPGALVGMPPAPAADAPAGVWDAYEQAMDKRVAEIHAERYPDGCGPCAGHHCETCLARLGQHMHRVQTVTRGSRAYYRGTLVHSCTECDWREG